MHAEHERIGQRLDRIGRVLVVAVRTDLRCGGGEGLNNEAIRKMIRLEGCRGSTDLSDLEYIRVV